ncbi:MAG: hypothetical protein ACF8K1_06360 [Phycisphaerales bacterium JB047]
MAPQKRTSSWITRTTIAPVAAGILGTLMLTGCISYTNVPEPESAPAFKSANHSQAIRVTRVALDEVIQRYPMRDAQGHYSVNLPVGTTLESAQKIVQDLPDGVVLPYEGMDDSIPVYHIGRIWIRASDAKVDVLYPARSFDGDAFTGNVTIWLNGGVRTWKLNRVQHWAPGTIGIPPLYVPLPEEVLDQRYTENEGSDSDASFGEELESHEGETETVSEPEPIRNPEPEPQQPTTQQPAAPQQGAHYREIPVED